MQNMFLSEMFCLSGSPKYSLWATVLLLPIPLLNERQLGKKGRLVFVQHGHSNSGCGIGIGYGSQAGHILLWKAIQAEMDKDHKNFMREMVTIPDKEGACVVNLREYNKWELLCYSHWVAKASAQEAGLRAILEMDDGLNEFWY